MEVVPGHQRRPAVFARYFNKMEIYLRYLIVSKRVSVNATSLGLTATLSYFIIFRIGEIMTQAAVSPI